MSRPVISHADNSAHIMRMLPSLTPISCSCVFIQLKHAYWKLRVLAGLKSVAALGNKRLVLGNVLASCLAAAGAYATYLSFSDPESGKYQTNVEFTNWSATHSVTAKYGPSSPCLSSSLWPLPGSHSARLMNPDFTCMHN